MAKYTYQRNTFLLGLFFGFSGANALLSYLFFDASREWLWMSIALLSVTPVIVMDKREGNKSNFAVWSGAFLHLFVTAFGMVQGFEPILTVLYLLELALCIYIWRKK